MNKIIDDGSNLIGKKYDLEKHLQEEIFKQFQDAHDDITSYEDCLYNAKMVYELMYESDIFVNAESDDYLQINYDNGFGELLVYKVVK